MNQLYVLEEFTKMSFVNLMSDLSENNLSVLQIKESIHDIIQEEMNSKKSMPSFNKTKHRQALRRLIHDEFLEDFIDSSKMKKLPFEKGLYVCWCFCKDIVIPHDYKTLTSYSNKYSKQLHNVLSWVLPQMATAIDGEYLKEDKELKIEYQEKIKELFSVFNSEELKFYRTSIMGRFSYSFIKGFYAFYNQSKTVMLSKCVLESIKNTDYNFMDAVDRLEGTNEQYLIKSTKELIERIKMDSFLEGCS